MATDRTTLSRSPATCLRTAWRTCAAMTPAGPRGRPTKACRSKASELRQAGPHRLAACRARREAARGCPDGPATCCSTSTSGFPRSTRTVTSRAPTISTRTGSRSPADWNRRTPAELDHALRSLGITADTTVDPVRPRHRGRREREVAGAPGRADRRHARGVDPALRRRRRRASARRRLRLVGPGRQPGRDDASPARVGAGVRRGRSRSARN